LGYNRSLPVLGTRLRGRMTDKPSAWEALYIFLTHKLKERRVFVLRRKRAKTPTTFLDTQESRNSSTPHDQSKL
jgi:hypothetical protein